MGWIAKVIDRLDNDYLVEVVNNDTGEIVRCRAMNPSPTLNVMPKEFFASVQRAVAENPTKSSILCESSTETCWDDITKDVALPHTGYEHDDYEKESWYSETND